MIEFRPHHFMCTLGFEGKGYSDAFVLNMRKIADELRENGEAGDQTEIRVVAGSDTLCGPCPSRQGAVCSTEEKIRTLDNAHSAVLGIRPGDTLTWGEAKDRIRESMTVEKFHEACAPCGWRTQGMCESALLRLRSEKK